MTTDDALAAQAAAGDRGALEPLLDRHADRVHAVCRRVLADPEDALDATQEALIAIARAITRFDGRSPLHHLALPRRHQRRARRGAAGRRGGPVPSSSCPSPWYRATERTAAVDGPHRRRRAHCRSCPRTSGSRSCCATCATSTTPRSPPCSTSRPAPCGRGSRGAARCSPPCSGETPGPIRDRGTPQPPVGRRSGDG